MLRSLSSPANGCTSIATASPITRTVDDAAAVYDTDLVVKVKEPQPAELPLLIQCSKAAGIRPRIGARVKLSSRVSGHWNASEEAARIRLLVPGWPACDWFVDGMPRDVGSRYGTSACGLTPNSEGVTNLIRHR